MLEKILVPLDGTELADRVLGQVKRLLHREDARVSLVRVVPDETRARGAGTVELAKLHVGSLRDDLVAAGARAEAFVLTGDPTVGLLQFIDAERPDLVVMSSHARGAAGRLLHGSVAIELVRRSPVPVLVCNQLGLAGAARFAFRRLLVPLDGSPLAEQALPLATELARLHGSELVLMNAIPIPTGDLPATQPLGLEGARALLESHVTRCRGVPTRAKVTLGSAAAAIVDVAAEEGCDLIVLTTHGRTGTARLAFGSVAEQVLRHASCPLVVVRPQPVPALQR